MKLTDIDLSSLAEVAAAAALLEHVHRELATGGTPLPTIQPAEFVVNPAPAPAITDSLPSSGIALAAADFGAQGLTNLSSAQPLDAASVFGGAPAQSAAPLALPALSTAGVAPSPTAPAAQPASGLAPLVSPDPAPLPAASAVAPAALAPHASHAGGAEVDADGLPWDERIHAGTKRKNADGRWTAKRGINDPDLVPRVVAQLRAQMAAGGVTTQPATCPAPHVTPAPVDALKTLAASPIQAPSAAPLPLSTPAPAMVPLASLAAPTPPALPAALPLAAQPQSLGGKPTPTTFADFMTAATVEVQSGRLTALQFGEACKLYGGPAGLAANPAAIPTVWAALKAQYPGML